MIGDSYWDWDELKIGTQQGILEVNQVMTWSGALTSSTATSSSTVTQRQQGQMHEMGSLHAGSATKLVDLFQWQRRSIDPDERRKEREQEEEGTQAARPGHARTR
jgi:hypothetical protein